MRRVLNATFTTNYGDKFSMSVPFIREGIVLSEIEEAMEGIVSLDMITSKHGRLTGLHRADVTETISRPVGM